MTVKEKKIVGYLPADTPPWGAMLSLGFQQVLTMFPATVLVAILTKFDVGITLLACGLGTIIALLVSKRKIPMYYGSIVLLYCRSHHGDEPLRQDCFTTPPQFYCPEGVRIVQVGIILTAVVRNPGRFADHADRQGSAGSSSASDHHRFDGHGHRYCAGWRGAGNAGNWAALKLLRNWTGCIHHPDCDHRCSRSTCKARD